MASYLSVSSSSLKQAYVLGALALATASSSAIAANDIFQVSGFGRLVIGKLDTKQAGFQGYSDHPSISPDSLLGAQINAYANEYLSFTAQGVMRANDDRESDIDWLYATYQPSTNLSFKAGKMRMPFLMNSDVSDVGYAYHWISPPRQIYNAFLFPTFKGIDIAWGNSGELFDSTLEVYYGETSSNVDFNDYSTTYDADPLRGLIGKIHYGNIELRTSLHQAEFNVALPEFDALANAAQSLGNYPATVSSLSSKSDMQVIQVSARYDNFDYFGSAEWVYIDPKLNTFIPEINSYYITGGYIIDAVTLHLTFAESKFDFVNFPTELNDALSNMSPNDPRYAGTQQLVGGIQSIEALRVADSLRSWTLGARWDIEPGVALKADITLLQGKKGDQAMFDSFGEDFDHKAYLYQVALDWVF